MSPHFNQGLAGVRPSKFLNLIAVIRFQEDVSGVTRLFPNDGRNSRNCFAPVFRPAPSWKKMLFL
jgi:hypothetical protein